MNLKALSADALGSFVKDAGLPAFRGRQILHWVYERGAQSLDEITELSKKLRDDLSERAYISNLIVLDRQTSGDGTEKFLFGLEDGETIESVLIPDEERLTLCVSSQVGCAMGCVFCLTGKLELKRNLDPHEIVDQVISINRLIFPRRITNIVLMGMGEPLANFDSVVEALRRITGYMKISPKRVTLSTSGIVPKIVELGRNGPKVNLAISLNATTDTVRDRIMPINKTYQIKAVLEACRRFPLQPTRRITFEYVMLKGINDSVADAKRLVRLLHGISSKINLIPFNPFSGCEYARPDDSRVLQFQEILAQSDMTVIIRKSKGQDILAACGQLRAGYKG
ncbi:MAG TPA: 23S rRNA (adenine(2503)-C(2))-methyltransferase RlmN [Dissulfurispiraceae bacterium]|nr:23S rRNA (adenine(2503)-C(2))-methyltransferase RlmN [Dissulfurispiraceae bacterium]